MKKKPTGFVAICQCGLNIGALDYLRTERRESGKILGDWLNNGCTVEPRFDDNWQARINNCQCDPEQPGNDHRVVTARQ